MREFLAEVHYKAWIATAAASALAVSCASLHLALPAVLAAMIAGAILMWISEEESRLVAAMAPDAAPATPAPVPAPVLEASAPAASAPAKPVPEAPISMVRIREWANPFPAPPSARRLRPQGRRAQRQRVAATVLSD